jgi:alpha-D-xyloside xylohydrolase
MRFRKGSFPGMLRHRVFRVVLVQPGRGIGEEPATIFDRDIDFSGGEIKAQLK